MSTVVPLLRESAQPNESLYDMVRGLNVNSLASYFLQAPQSLVQLGLLLGTFDPELVNYTVAILDMLSDSSVIMERKGRNKLIDVFAICGERRQILYNLSSRIDNTLDNTSDKLYLQSTGVILRFLLNHLPQNNRQVTASHLLLGFKIDEQGSISQGSDRGCVGSEVSPLRSVFGLLNSLIYDGSELNQQHLDLKELASAIILTLYESDLTFGILRDTFGSMRAMLPIDDLKRKLIIAGDTADETVGVAIDLRYRSCLLQIVSLDIHILSVENSASSIQLWMDVLFGSAQNSNDNGYGNGLSTSNYPYVEFEISTLVEAAGLEFDDSHRERIDAIFTDLRLPYSSRPSRFGFQEIDVSQVSQSLLIMGRQRGTIEDSKETLSTQKAQLEYMVLYNSVMELAVSRNKYLLAWTNYLLIVLEDCFGLWDRNNKYQLVEALQRKLVERLISLRRIDQVTAKALSSAILATETTLKAKESIRVSSDVIHDTIKGLSTAEKIYGAFHSTFSDEIIRENFYIYLNLQIASFQHATLSQEDSTELTNLKHEVTKEVYRVVALKKYRLLDHLLSDSINADWNCQLYATMFFTTLCKLDTLDDQSDLWSYLDERRYLSILGKSLAQFYSDNSGQRNLDGRLPFRQGSFSLFTDNGIAFLITESRFRLLCEIGSNRNGSLLMLKSDFFNSMREFFIPPVDLLAMDGTAFQVLKSEANLLKKE